MCYFFLSFTLSLRLVLQNVYGIDSLEADPVHYLASGLRVLRIDSDGARTCALLPFPV